MNAYVVSREDLAHNVECLKKQANGVPVWGVVKADGYGLGAARFAQELYALGIDRFCVTELREAELIRASGLHDAQILMLRQVCEPCEIERLIELNVILTLGSLEAAKRIKKPAEVHLKIDTGMGRYGFLPNELEAIRAVYQEKHLKISGIYTHFSCAFNSDSLTKQQFAAFCNVVDTLRAAGMDVGTVHCCNSAAFLKFPEMHLGGVRLGSALLGRMPFATQLRPLGYAETQIEEIRTLPAGHTTGYGAIWKAKRESKIAIIPVGWYHGLQVSCKPDRSRAKDCIRGMLGELKNILKRPRMMVEISGKACPLVGAIGSLHCAVDVTGVDCEVGQKVTLPISPLHIKGMEVQFR